MVTDELFRVGKNLVSTPHADVFGAKSLVVVGFDSIVRPTSVKDQRALRIAAQPIGRCIAVDDGKGFFQAAEKMVLAVILAVVGDRTPGFLQRTNVGSDAANAVRLLKNWLGDAMNRNHEHGRQTGDRGWADLR